MPTPRHAEPREGDRAWRVPPELRRAVALPTAVVAGAVVATAAVLDALREPTPDIFVHLIRVHDAPAAVLFLAILAAAPLVARGLARQTEAMRRLAALLAAIGRRPAAVAVPVAALLALATGPVYQRHPLSLDEWAPVYQATAFAAGSLWGEVPPPLAERLVPPFFVNTFWAVSPSTGRVISNYWPGHALLLTPFVALGAPWLLGPLLAALAVVLLARLTRRLGGDEAAGWAVALLVASPSFLANAVSFYAMTAQLAINLLFVVLVLAALRRPDRETRRLVLAGAVGGFALTLHQPVPHALVALPFLVWLSLGAGRVRRLAALALGYFPAAMVLGVGWFLLRAGFQAEWAAAQAERGRRLHGGGGPLALLGELLGALFALPDGHDVALRLAGLLKLVLWSVPGLPLVAAVGLWDRRRETAPALFGTALLVTLGVFAFIPISQGHGWGFRYLHQLEWTLPLLAGLALAAPRRAAWRPYLAVVLAASLLLAVPLRGLQIRRFIGAHLAQLPEVPATGQHVVFLQPRRGYYLQDLVRNDPFLRDRVLTMLSAGVDEDAALMARLFPGSYPVRLEPRGTVWRLAPPSAASAGHRDELEPEARREEVVDPEEPLRHPRERP